MKLTKTKPNWLLTLILTFHIISAQIEGSVCVFYQRNRSSKIDSCHQILIVGIRGDSRFSAADILSGRTDGGQEDREIVKTPVITDEGRRMILINYFSHDFPLILGSALVLGTLISIRSWSGQACHARDSPVFALGSFLFCAVGATLSMGFVNVFALLGMNMTIMLLISGLTMAYWHLKSETLHNVIDLSVLTLFFSCGCVLIGSVFLILGLMMSFLKVLIESLVSSYLFYVALLLIVMWRRQTASVQVTNRD
ncbi:hypothetical protein ABG768_017761 [Culter alburnus]|uniref:Uncharacterized protein n=1 Tax=Culter alburnus TaxID=194366 RepID=A0AAW1YT27_CULAL